MIPMKEQIIRVKNCKTCPLYDDGAGNGSYQSGMYTHESNYTNPKSYKEERVTKLIKL